MVTDRVRWDICF